MGDVHFDKVVSLLNFSGMADGNTITDLVSGTTWDVPAGTSVVSGGRLVLANNGDYIRQIDDETGIRQHFNGVLSKVFTIEGKLAVKKVTGTNPWLGWRDSESAKGMILRQPSGDPDEAQYSAGDSNTSGWEVDLGPSSASFSVDDEVEFCIQRDEGDFYFHINGTLVNSATGHDSLILAVGAEGLRLGRFDDESTTDAHIEVIRFRMTKEVARYGASSYTPLAGDDYPVGTGPIMTVQPESAGGYEGDRVTFSVFATGEGDLSYQWYQDGSPVGGDSAIYTTSALVLADDGDEVYVDVTDFHGTNPSDTAILSVIEPTEYPATYPCPTWDYNRRISSTGRRTAFDSGWVRQRRQFNTFPESIELSFIMDTEVFHTWFDWVIQNAYTWIKLPTDRFGGNTGTEVARFISELQYAYDNHNRVNVSVMAEVRNA